MFGSGTTYSDHAITDGKGWSELVLQANVVALVRTMAPHGSISLKMLREHLQSRMRVDLSGCKPAIRRYAAQAVQELNWGGTGFKDSELLLMRDGPHGNTRTHLSDGCLDVKAAASYSGKNVSAEPCMSRLGKSVSDVDILEGAVSADANGACFECAHRRGRLLFTQLSDEIGCTAVWRGIWEPLAQSGEGEPNVVDSKVTSHQTKECIRRTLVLGRVQGILAGNLSHSCQPVVYSASKDTLLVTEGCSNGDLATVAMCCMFPANTSFSFDSWACVSAEFGVMWDPGGKKTSFTPGPVPMTRPCSQGFRGYARSLSETFPLLTSLCGA
mmetsp:Transcript_56553/g.135019  ORF Transcript_56553/g.135019 Transcript_56553/m.135019 type:complete len:328 (+) Transcript_56553:63-1046(+)